MSIFVGGEEGFVRDLLVVEDGVDDSVQVVNVGGAVALDHALLIAACEDVFRA